MIPPLPMDALARVARQLPGGGLSAVRQAALASFAERGFPTLRDEDWKYTDLSRVAEISRDWLAAGAPGAPADADAIRAARRDIDAHWLVIANGELLDRHPAVDHPDVDRHRAGQADVDRHPDVDRHAELDRQTHAAELDRQTHAGLDRRLDMGALSGLELRQGEAEGAGFAVPLADLNAALSRHVLELRIGDSWPDDKPIALLIADTAGATAIASQVRIRVAVGASAAVEIIEYHLSSGSAAHWSNVQLDVDLEPNAQCRWVRIQDRALTHSQTARLSARLARDARFEHFGLDLGGELARNDLQIDIAGENATAVLNGFYLAGPGQHVDNHTRTEHRIGPAFSSQEYRGVLSGRCRAVWNGKAIVHPGADGTDARQANHNLLLSEHAEIDAKPELEIYADDVKAAHGTTVGQLDERALFYLRTRGIGLARAKRILTRAFAATVVNTVPIEGLRELIAGKVEARLRAMADASEGRNAA